jgi:hypothetical protein
MRSTACRLDSVLKIRRPSDFLSKAPISNHLSCPHSEGRKVSGRNGGQTNLNYDTEGGFVDSFAAVSFAVPPESDSPGSGAPEAFPKNTDMISFAK